MGPEQSVRIILQFIDQASGPLAGATGTISKAISGMRQQINANTAVTIDRMTKLSGNVSLALIDAAASMRPTSPFLAGFSGLAQTVGTTATFIGKQFKSMFTGASALSSLFIGPMAVGLSASLVNIAADAEQTRVSFETLLKSPTEASGLMKWIEDFSIKTPLMRKEVEQATKAFLAYGMNLDTAKRATVAAVEATSALGLEDNKLARISVNLGQIYNSQRVRETELKELRLAGVQVNQIFNEAVRDGTLKMAGFGDQTIVTAGVSKKLTTAYQTANKKLDVYKRTLQAAEIDLKKLSDAGKTNTSTFLRKQNAVDNARNALSKATGTITEYTQAQSQAGKVIKIVADNTKELTTDQLDMIKDMYTGRELFDVLEKGMLKLYGGASIRQVKTFSGAMSNFGDVFNTIVRRAMGISSDGTIQIGGFFDKIRNAAATAIEYLINNMDNVGKFFNQFLNHKEVIVVLAGALVGILVPALTMIIAPLVLLAAKWAILAFIINQTVELLGGWSAMIKKAKDALESLQPIIGWIIDNKDYILGAIAGIAAGIAIILVPAFLAWASAAVVAGVATLVALAPIIAIIAIFALIGVAIVYLIKHWQQITQTVQNVVTVIGIWLGNLWNTISTTFNNIIISVGNFVTNVVTWFTNLPAQVMSAVYNLFVVQIPYAIGFLIGFLFVRLPVMWIMMVMGFIDTGAKIIAEVSTWPGRFMLWLVQMIAQAIMAIDTFGQSFWTSITTTGINMVNEIATWPARIMTWLNTLPGLIAKWLIDVLGKFTAGLDNIWKTVVGWKDKIIGAFNAVGDAIQRALDLAGKAFAKGIRAGAGFQHGGIVPGPVGAAVPIMAHAGERVVPRGATDVNGGGSGGGVTINFNGALTVDSEDRVRQLADRVIAILGRQNELAKWGMI